MTQRSFGQLADGTEVDEVTIAAGDLTAKVIAWGAVIRDVRLAGVDNPLVLGFERMEDYVAHSPYFGAVAGRCANRIADGRFVIDGETYEVERNEKGVTHLHGGSGGFGKRVWRIAETRPDSVLLALTSADGDQGYPGEVEASCRYTIEPPGTLRVDFDATTSRPSPVNLAQHSYFNLDGSDDILDHEVQIFAETYTPTDSRDIPSGAIVPVAGTDYDFRAARPVRLMRDGAPVPYDMNFVTAMDKTNEPHPMAKLRSKKNGVTLDVASTEPGVQFYTGFKMNIPVPGLDGRRYGPGAGCCFEPQFFPDAVNQPDFTSPVLRPGEHYRQTTLFAFGRS